MEFPRTRALLDAAIRARATPAAVVETGTRDGVDWTAAFGTLSFEAGAPAATLDTVFDLASLTKVIATSTLVMQHVAGGRLGLDSPVGDLLPAWRDAAHAAVTVRHLLDHSSGLPAHARFWETISGREAYAAAIHALPFAYPIGSRAVYSDLGFMTLGFALATLAGPLDAQFRAWSARAGTGTDFRPADDLLPRIAPTEVDPWRGHLLRGEAHDENAAALGGVAGHAGLFGTAAEVGRFARLVLTTFEAPTALGTPTLLAAMVTPSRVPGSSRALGWDTMRPTSSCGTRLSASAIGHTGFTGTSLWIDPERNRYVVLLSNRVHPSRTNDAFVRLRPPIHDAIADDLAG